MEQEPDASSDRLTSRRSRGKEPVEPTVLVVDDDADTREWLRLGLSLRGWTVEEAVTGAEAIERLALVGLDVVLLDHHMPGMTGIECAARLREMSSDLRIILASAHIDAEVIRSARELRILPIAKSDHERLFDLFELLARQLQTRREHIT